MTPTPPAPLESSGGAFCFRKPSVTARTGPEYSNTSNRADHTTTESMMRTALVFLAAAVLIVLRVWLAYKAARYGARWVAV